jgi:DNA-binding XRE family transcriptional regulator
MAGEDRKASEAGMAATKKHAPHPGGRPRKRTPTAWGKRVDKLAEARGLTRRELAERVGISPVSLWQFLMGQARPRLETAGRMADVLGVPLDKLR